MSDMTDDDWQKWLEGAEYLEAVDAMLDGTIPGKDKDGKPILLKERVKLLLDQLESTADKLSDCWLLLDEIARRPQMLTSCRAAAENMLRRQQCPGWKETAK